MSKTLEIPQSSASLIVATVLAKFIVAYLIVASDHGPLALIIVAAFVGGGFLIDLVSSLVHFGLDHAVPSYRVHIFGPISREFHNHHDRPVRTIMESNYRVNFTKGSYASLPFLVVALALAWTGIESALSCFIIATLAWMSIWGMFVNQIHAYSHMGSKFSPEEFDQHIERIKSLPTEADQRREYRRIFDSIQIPRAVRLLQNLRIILSPSQHNMHHINFDRDFGVINGWSNPVANLVLIPLARCFR